MKKINLIIFILILCLTNLSIVNAKPTAFDIKYNVNDPEGRCGNPKKNNCMAVATVTYDNDEKITYYMPKQYDSEGLIIDGSCRAHALTCIANALTNSNYYTLDLQNYLLNYSPKDGRLMASNLNDAISFFKLKATPYYSDITKNKMIQLIYDAFKNNQPAMLFVNSRCKDLAGTNHALVLLGTDKDNNVVFIDSSGYSKNAKKRTVNELVNNCYVSNNVANNYFNVITFNETAKTSEEGGTTFDYYPDGFINKVDSNNDFTCHTIFLDEYGNKTEFKKILDDIFAFIQILAPLFAIVLTIIDFYKVLTTQSDPKKAIRRTIIRIVIATLIVFLPLLLELLFHLFGLYDLSTCEIGQ